VIAVVLVGGLGTRLRAEVPNVPKCMSPVGGRPFLERVLGRLKSQGVERLILCIGYRGDLIRQHFGSGDRFGVSICYSDDGPRPRGTGGALALALRTIDGPLDEHVLTMNGDTWVEFNLAVLREKHAAKRHLVLVATRVPDVSRFGSLETGRDGAVVAFHEKGSGGPGLINAGVYFGNRSLLQDLLPHDRYCNIETDVLPALAGQALYAIVNDGGFIDIGVPDDYRRAQTMFKE
jgi:D-glycero-alpha-D-manno-heptose 1-phosphate guanylyltransferase